MSKSKHNYTQYAKNPKSEAQVEEAPVAEMVAPVAEPEAVNDVVTTVAAPEVPMEIKMESLKPEKPKTATGIVVNCTKLNVRKAPAVNADAVCVLDKGSQVEINMPKSKKEWFSVCTAAGIEGYCMRKYVEVNL